MSKVRRTGSGSRGIADPDDPKMKAPFVELGSTVFPNSPAEFGKFIAAETEKWAS
jgi:hypothetical protein